MIEKIIQEAFTDNDLVTLYVNFKLDIYTWSLRTHDIAIELCVLYNI